MKKRLTDNLIHALKPHATGKRYLVHDTIVPGLAVRVRKHKTFVLIARFNSKHPTRRSLGVVGKVTLDEARDKARDWHRQLARGIDPQYVARTETFGDVCDQFVHHIRHAADDWLSVTRCEPKFPREVSGPD